jgi:hypothetical protein
VLFRSAAAYKHLDLKTPPGLGKAGKPSPDTDLFDGKSA